MIAVLFEHSFEHGCHHWHNMHNNIVVGFFDSSFWNIIEKSGWSHGDWLEKKRENEWVLRFHKKKPWCSLVLLQHDTQKWSIKANDTYNSVGVGLEFWCDGEGLHISQVGNDTGNVLTLVSLGNQVMTALEVDVRGVVGLHGVGLDELGCLCCDLGHFFVVRELMIFVWEWMGMVLIFVWRGADWNF